MASSTGPWVFWVVGSSPTSTTIKYHTQLAKMSFDEIFDLTAGVYFHFL